MRAPTGQAGKPSKPFTVTKRGSKLAVMDNAGRITLTESGQVFRADWRATGGAVELTSPLGAARVHLGALRTAPAAVAREQFREMVREALRAKV